MMTKMLTNVKDIGIEPYQIAPKTKEHLAWYMACILKVQLSHGKACNGHKSQLDILWDAYAEINDFMIVHAVRGGGKTFLMSALSYLESIFKFGCGISILGGSLEQSIRCVGYLNDFWNNNQSPRYMLINGQVAGRGYKLNNGSWVTALAASTKSTRGPHPAKLMVDEADELDKKVYDAALGQPKAKGNIKDHIIISSTLHNPFGLMSDIIDSRYEIGAKLYQFCINEVTGKHGFYTKEEMERKKRQLTKAMWECEYLLKRPKIGDSIWDFESIDKAYIRGFKIEFNPKIPVEAGIDWGHTCTVMSIIQDTKESINIPKAYPWEYQELNERCKDIAEICIEKKIQIIYCDSNPKDSYVTLKSVLKKKRVPTIVTPIAFNQWKDTGIDVIRYYLEKNLINIKDKILQEKMKRYHYKNADQGIIDKIDDHFCDSLIAWASSRWRILSYVKVANEK